MPFSLKFLTLPVSARLLLLSAAVGQVILQDDDSGNGIHHVFPLLSPGVGTVEKAEDVYKRQTVGNIDLWVPCRKLWTTST